MNPSINIIIIYILLAKLTVLDTVSLILLQQFTKLFKIELWDILSHHVFLLRNHN